MSIKILIRFDDICPTMNFEKWEMALKILKKYNIKPLLGVIPDCQDSDLKIESEHPEFWETMRNLQKEGYTLAMHGCSHLCESSCHGIVNYGIGSEFAGYDFETQFNKIAHGKEILENHGIYTDVFFAPRHSYDTNTLKALAACGFKYVSDGKSRKPFCRNGVICIPCRASGCPRINKSGYYTAVFHAHEWVREDKKEGYESLKKLCSQYHEHIVGFDSYSQRECGNYFVQIIDEFLYLTWEFRIKPVLRRIKDILMNRRKM